VPRLRCLQPCSASNGGTVAERRNRGTRGFKLDGILGLYRNPESHITQSPGQGNFVFIGYDLVDEVMQVSALTNCGGFPKAFSNQELTPQGLIQDYGRAVQVRVALAEAYPEEHHAQCELYAIWRLNELPQQV
jgi:hypothetical protein